MGPSHAFWFAGKLVFGSWHTAWAKWRSKSGNLLSMIQNISFQLMRTANFHISKHQSAKSGELLLDGVRKAVWRQEMYHIIGIWTTNWKSHLDTSAGEKRKVVDDRLKNRVVFLERAWINSSNTVEYLAFEESLLLKVLSRWGRIVRGLTFPIISDARDEEWLNYGHHI